MRPEEAILFSDLDGTLFSSRGEISRENRAAVARFIAAGGKFAISSGRAARNAVRVIRGLPTNAPSIVFNGAGVCDLTTGEYAYTVHLDREQTDPVMRRLLEEFPGMDFQVYTEEEILYCTPLETAQPAFLEAHQPTRYIPFGELEGKPMIKCLQLPQQERFEEMGELLRAYAPGRYDLKPGAVTMRGERLLYYETMPPAATKGAAMRKLRTHPALAGRTIFAVGDYWNDEEMLREADVPICPANAPEELKALCRFVTASNDEHAIAHIIDEIIPAV